MKTTIQQFLHDQAHAHRIVLGVVAGPISAVNTVVAVAAVEAFAD